MYRIPFKAYLVLFSLFGATSAQAQVDSYRFAHVTIATPWYIFLFLMVGVFFPFVLMAVLAWRNALRKIENETAEIGSNATAK